MRIDEKIINEIRNKADIVDLIGQVLPLEKKGKDYVTVCPFHDDHDPSMRISPDKQIYKCFVCGAGGNVFTFFQKHEGLTFVQAVKKVADLIGYPLELPNEQPRPVHPDKPLFDALNLFTDYCSYELSSKDGKAAYAYLQKRKFSDRLIETYQIGYSPARQMTAGFLESRIKDRTLLEKTGLIHADREDISPVFHERIMIPIHDPFGNPVGYTARKLPESTQNAKYINSPSSALYDKSSLIFNYHRALRPARKNGRLILCEGAMDVLGLAKAGIEEGIACLGTALTPAQLSLIARVQVPVIVYYDQDSAGKRAAYKFGKLALESGISFSIVSIAEAKDPDDLFVEKGAKAVVNAVETTISYAQFCLDYLQSVYRLENYEDKKAYAKEMERLINTTLEPFERPALMDRLEEITGFHFQKEGQRKKSSSYGRRRSKSQISSLPPMPKPAGKGRLQAEKSVLWAILFHPDYLERFKQEVGFFSDPVCSQLFVYLNYAYRTNREIDPVGLAGEIAEEEARALLIELAEWPDYSDILETQFNDSVIKIKLDILSHELDVLNEQIHHCTDFSRRIALNVQKQKTIQKKNDILLRKES